MNKQEIIKTIFTHPHIDKKDWIFRADVDWDKTEVRIDNGDDNYIMWIKGIWHDGIWESGFWYNGQWHDGVWIEGIWKDGHWFNGRWEDGTWHSGTWHSGTWHYGEWKDGTWEDGIWNKGFIYNPKTKKYEYSGKNPNETEWSLSFGKA